MPSPRVGAPPCKGRVSGATPEGGSAANAAGITPQEWEVAGSSPAGPTSWDRSSAVERQTSLHLSSLHFAAQAQTAGHLTGTEAMEGAIPSGGSAANAAGTTSSRVRIPPVPLRDRSSGVEHVSPRPLVAALSRWWFKSRISGRQLEDPGAIPGHRSGRMQKGLHWLIARARAGSNPATVRKDRLGLFVPRRPHRVAANAVRTTPILLRWCLRAPCLHPLVAVFCGEEQRLLAWLITKRPSVRIRPPLPLRSWGDAGPHKPERDGSSPSAATVVRSGPTAGLAPLKALRWGFESLLRNDCAELALW